MTQTYPYGAWPSVITARSVVSGVVGFSELKSHVDELFWLESRPEEQGRSVLMKLDRDGQMQMLTPPPYNVRSRVHEYGGGAYCLADDDIYFCNFADQNIYRLTPDGTIEAVTSSEPTQRFADCCWDALRNRLLCVVEQHHPESDSEPDNYLAAIDLHTGEVKSLHADYDFYSSPRLNAAGDALAVIAWSHPNMPWDGTLLMRTGFDETGSPSNMTVIAGGASESVTQPTWLDDGSLIYISDANGYYNLYAFDDAGSRCVLADGADYAAPAWVFGGCEYAAIDERHLAAVRQTESGPEMVLIDLQAGLASPITGGDDGWCRFDALCVLNGNLGFIAGFADRLPAIERLNISTRSSQRLASAGELSFAAAISVAEAEMFPTRDGAVAHGYFYPPASDSASAPANSLPPLLVMSHGGPTAATDGALNLRIQYYTSRGWAVLDVNYRGSSGFGRAYRDALNGRWGELDVFDCEDGVRYLIAQGRVDPSRVAIRGGSAGGFTTLAALTTTSTFKVGASHYGIGDLTALVADTHKFESRYMHTLLASEENLVARSPIHHLDGLSCPVIFFQGEEDKVVPPNQSEAMVEALKKKGIPVAYVLFPGEGHGFRSADNIVNALESELSFFSSIFNIDVADDLPDVEIIRSDQGAA